MHEAVNAADIHKRAEIRKPAYNAVQLGADLQSSPLLLFLRFHFCEQYVFLGGDDAFAGLVHFDYGEFHGLSDKVREVFNIFCGDMRCGHESAYAVYGGDQAALDDFFTNRVKYFAFGFRVGQQLFPEFLAFHALAGEQHIAFAVVYLGDFHFNAIANLHDIHGVDIRIGGEFVPGNEPIGFIADIDAYFAFRNLYDCPVST